MSKGRLLDRTRRWISEEYNARFDGEAVAARSSSVGEDSQEASFAGQHLTVLNLSSGQALADAVVEVWRSARTAAARAYRAKLGISEAPRIGVVVQRMLSPDCAGVLFTRNPIDRVDERVIEATWGLGEAVVSGLVTPDWYRVRRGGEVLERRAGDKDLAIVSAAEGGTREVPITSDRVSELCLDDGKLEALDALATRCEASFEGASDIEWAFVGEQLYLLQRREVTR